ncbi:MAG TPA: hypothetical protein VGB49_05200, partial [Caulobacteraceae bacterium]
MSALADQLLRDGYPNQAVLLGAAIEDGRRVMRRRTVLHVVTRGDSQALPRPIRYDQHSVENPYLAVRFDECFPAVFAGLLEDLSGRRVLSSNTSIRGADVGQYL